jgi:hypothetical protein
VSGGDEGSPGRGGGFCWKEPLERGEEVKEKNQKTNFNSAISNRKIKVFGFKNFFSRIPHVQ